MVTRNTRERLAERWAVECTVTDNVEGGRIDDLAEVQAEVFVAGELRGFFVESDELREWDAVVRIEQHGRIEFHGIVESLSFHAVSGCCVDDLLDRLCLNCKRLAHRVN